MDLSAEGTAERTVYAVLPVEIKGKQIDFQDFINMGELRTNIKRYKILSSHIIFMQWL